jgi:hypothetical protein
MHLHGQATIFKKLIDCLIIHRRDITLINIISLYLDLIRLYIYIVKHVLI